MLRTVDYVDYGLGTGGWGDLYEAISDDDLASYALFVDDDPRKRTRDRTGKGKGKGKKTNGDIVKTATPRHPPPPPALSSDAQVRAYRESGFGPEVEDSIRQMTQTLRPKIVTGPEFQRAVQYLAEHILHLATPTSTMWSPMAVLVFVIEPKIKSNLWLFLMTMRSMQRKLNNDGQWKRLRARIRLTTLFHRYTDETENRETGMRGVKGGEGKDGKRTKASGGKIRDEQMKEERDVNGTEESRIYIVTDDCVYSGSQMSYMVERIGRSDPHATEIHVCPLFATAKGLERVLSGARRGSIDARKKTEEKKNKKGVSSDDIVISSWISNIIGHDASDVVHDLFSMDIAFCFRTRTHFVITSLFQTLGIVHYRTSMKTDSIRFNDDVVFEGQNITSHARMTGSAIAFQHKVADGVSIPTDWFLLGPTLRTEIEKKCVLAACDVSNSVYDIGVCPMSTLMRAVDGMRIPSNVQDVKSGKRENQKDETKTDAYRFMWFDGVISSHSGEKIIVINEQLDPLFNKKIKGSVTQMYRSVHLDNMPVYAPLVDPISSCGFGFAESHNASQRGDPFKMTNTEAMVQLTGSGARCVHPPYKHVLRERLEDLVECQKKAHRLADILSVKYDD